MLIVWWETTQYDNSVVDRLIFYMMWSYVWNSFISIDSQWLTFGPLSTIVIVLTACAYLASTMRFNEKSIHLKDS